MFIYHLNFFLNRFNFSKNKKIAQIIIKLFKSVFLELPMLVPSNSKNVIFNLLIKTDVPYVTNGIE